MLTSNLDAVVGMDALQTLVALLDKQGRVQAMNAAFEDHLGISRRSATGRFFHEWLDGQQADVLQDLLLHKLDNNAHLRLHLAPFLLQIQTVTHDSLSVHGQGTQILVEATPVTWVSQHLEAEQAQAEVRRSKELMRNLAHEIKNPLGGIRGAAQLLQRSVTALGADKETLHLTHIVMKEADRLKSLVDKFLVPNPTALQREALSIYEVLERVRSVLLAEYPVGLAIVRDYDVSLPELYAEREALIQAVLNLGRNALQAMQTQLHERRAQLTLKTRVVRKLNLQGQQHPLALELSVIDNGVGIAPDFAERIFQPLVSGRSDGTGLGLTLSQSIAAQHGGALFLKRSQPGHTEFCIQLPLPTTSQKP